MALNALIDESQIRCRHGINTLIRVMTRGSLSTLGAQTATKLHQKRLREGRMEWEVAVALVLEAAAAAVAA